MKQLQVETGYSKDTDGTFKAHITILIPGKEAQLYHMPGFKSPEDANAWTKQQVRDLALRINAAQVREKLTHG